MLYFAYGSNMDPRQMRKRCPSAKFVCLDFINNQVLEFSKQSSDMTGKATIRKKKGSVVYGAVYVVNEKDMFFLDNYEGVGTHYERKYKITDNGYKCAVYIACREMINKKLLPSIEYKKKIMFGLKFIDAPVEYFNTINQIQAVKPKILLAQTTKIVYK